MNAGITLDLGLRTWDLIQNVPRNTVEQLAELDKRCISLLNELEESHSLDLEDRSVAGFLTEMETVLTGIHRKLENWKSLHPLSAFFQQATIRGWIASQNQKIEDAFRTMNTHLLVSHAIQIAEDRVRQERDQDEIRGYLTQILNEFRSQVSSETSLNIQPAGATLNVVSQSTDRYNRRTPHSPPIAGSSPDVLLPQVHRLVALEVPESQIGLCQTTRIPSICNKVEGRISSGNVEGLVYHLTRTDDDHLVQVMLDTHRDFTTPEHFFDVIQQCFKEVRREMGPYHIERHKIIEAVIAWLRTLERESNISYRVREFALAADNGLIPNHQNMILKAIDDQTRGPISPNYSDVKDSEEPMDPLHLAVALTLIEADLRKSIRWIDYLQYEKGLPSRIDTLLSEHHKMIAWVQKSILCHKDMQARAHSIQRFTAAAEECRSTWKNYNSMTAIAQVLKKLNPQLNLPRTEKIDSEGEYRQYRQIQKGNAASCIPWSENRQLDDVKCYIRRSPRTLESELINFEWYQQFASEVPRYQTPADLEKERKISHLAYLRDQFDKIVVPSEQTVTRCLRRLKKREERAYQNRDLEWQRNGLYITFALTLWILPVKSPSKRRRTVKAHASTIYPPSPSSSSKLDESSASVAVVPPISTRRFLDEHRRALRMAAMYERWASPARSCNNVPPSRRGPPLRCPVPVSILHPSSALTIASQV
ncbi:ras guanine nucleotide exchange factor domain-containing protein [Mycena epipterygia]|nr:ras guanine nucleotide exchange factor domain-containing protein [Mycena epipterygia]